MSQDSGDPGEAALGKLALADALAEMLDEAGLEEAKIHVTCLLVYFRWK